MFLQNEALITSLKMYFKMIHQNLYFRFVHNSHISSMRFVLPFLKLCSLGQHELHMLQTPTAAK